MFSEITGSIDFQMTLLLFLALGGYILASRINQSAVVGEILVGLLVGPSLLGWITYTGFVETVAHLGAIILLFVVGLEFRLKDIFHIKYGFIAFLGVVIPWAFGYYLTKIFGFDSNSAIFVGTAMTATSIAITANVLKEMGKLQTEAAKAIIGAAVIDDVLSLLALSISEQMVHGTVSVTSISVIFLKGIGFLVVGTFIGYRIFAPAISKLDRIKLARMYPEFAFIFAMAIAFFYSMAAEVLGLSAIVGAFIAGISIGSVVLEHSKDYQEGAEYLHIIFSSIFFISLGVLADFHAIKPGLLLFLLMLTLLAVISKVVGCSIPAKLQGMNLKNSLVVGFGMSPRGEMAMVVGLIGLKSGIISQEIYVSLVFMSLLTTIITPIVLRNWLYK
jgi:Kef-type K+ transport system membrane component KefB